MDFHMKMPPYFVGPADLQHLASLHVLALVLCTQHPSTRVDRQSIHSGLRAER